MRPYAHRGKANCRTCCGKFLRVAPIVRVVCAVVPNRGVHPYGSAIQGDRAFKLAVALHIVARPAQRTFEWVTGGDAGITWLGSNITARTTAAGASRYGARRQANQPCFLSCQSAHTCNATTVTPSTDMATNLHTHRRHQLGSSSTPGRSTCNRRTAGARVSRRS